MIGNSFAGSGTLVRFIVRRDALRLIIWIIALAGFVVGLVPVFANILLNGDTDPTVMSNMMQNPAMIAIVGPVYGAGNYTAGAAYGNMMLVFSVMIAGIMNVFLVTRHTRQDEELGRLEVIRSLPVGRLSNLASTLLVALAVNVVLALVIGGGMVVFREEGMGVGGCMLFGAAMGATGMFFAALAAVFAQCSANNRTVVGLSFIALLGLYLLRAAGDLGTEVLALISPLGLILRTESFVHDYWWPVAVVAVIALALVALAFALAHIRDLSRGLFAEKRGSSHASLMLSGPIGLSWRLIHTSVIIWAVIAFMLAAMYGSVFGDLDAFISSNEMFKAIFAADPDFSLVEQFIALLMTVMAMIGSIPVLTTINRVASEEKHGYSENLFGRAVSRRHQMAAYLMWAMILSVVMQLLAALGFWSVGSLVLDDIPTLQTFLVSALSYLPAMWVLVGISMVLIAFIPKAVSFVYVYLGYALVAIYFGTIMNFPDWMGKITPFGFIPEYPIDNFDPVPLIVLTAVALVLMAVGLWRYGCRDMKTQEV